MNQELKHDLIKYLSQYRYCWIHLESLRRRLAEVKAELDCPLSAVKQDGMPKGNAKPDGAALSLAIRIEEAEAKMEEQRRATQEAFINIFNIMDKLPTGTLERRIAETRFLDRREIHTIAEMYYMSDRSVYNYIDKAYDILLNDTEVISIITKNKSLQTVADA